MIPAIIVVAFILALAVLWVRRRPNTPISEADLDRRLADIRAAKREETPHQRAVREESLNLILASDKLGTDKPNRAARERKPHRTPRLDAVRRNLVFGFVSLIGVITAALVPAGVVWVITSMLTESDLVSSGNTLTIVLTSLPALLTATSSVFLAVARCRTFRSDARRSAVHFRTLRTTRQPKDPT